MNRWMNEWITISFCLSQLGLPQQNSILSGLSNKNLFSLSSRAGSLRSGCRHGWKPVGTVSLDCRQLPSRRVLMGWRKQEQTLRSVLIRIPVIPSWGSTLITSSKSNYFPKDSASKYTQLYWVLGHQHVSFEGDTIQTIAPFNTLCKLNYMLTKSAYWVRVNCSSNH